MKRIHYYIIGAVAAAILITAIVFVSKGKNQKFKRVNPAFKEYITAFTSGFISTESPIQIRLSNDYVDSAMIGKPIEQELFKFEPAIKGNSYWTDRRTIEFRPESKLPEEQFYNAQFMLSNLLQVPDSMKIFEFQFQTIKQDFEVRTENHKAYDKKELKWEKLTGSLLTADVADNAKLEKVLTAEQNGKKLRISWTHEENRKLHHFTVDSVQRKITNDIVTLSWDGKAIDSKNTGQLTVEISSLNDFKFLDAKVFQEQDQYLLLQFTDPISTEQDMNGMVKIGNLLNLKYVVEDNEIRIYPASPQTGKLMVDIDANIKNYNGKLLGKKVFKEISFEELKPAVRLIGKGIIIPSSNGLIFPFEAVNLKAIDVKIVKIYENNITQFLQVNTMDGEREIARVGKTVLKKTIPLKSGKITDLSKWNKFSLDLAVLIKTEPGAIYRVSLSFKKEYSVFPCDGESKDDAMLSSWNNSDDDENDNGNYNSEYYYDYDYDYSYGYNWGDRNNPCSNSYYNYKKVARNVLASDLGIIAKRGNDGSINFFVTNIVTTKPISGVTLELFDYQQQLLTKTETDADGMAQVQMKKRPFLLIAKKDAQRGYLKLDDGTSLSLSMFDISGETVQKGLKGFIYGERGVWRPGDSLFLTFILEDKLNMLPKNHPILFDLINPKGQVVRHFVRSASENGFYNFSTRTDQNAPTGNYTASVKVGGATFTKDLKVETIMPNRLKINLDFKTDKLSKFENRKGALEVKWLHGAIAKKLKTEVNVHVSRSTTAFKGFPNYIFDDPSRNFSSENFNIFSGKLDELGKAEISPDINVSDAAPGILRASFETRVFEESGAFSVDRFSLPYYPYKTFVGIQVPEGDKFSHMLETNKKHIINIVNVDMNGIPTGNDKVKVDVYKVDWRWWYDSQEDELANYTSGSYNVPIQTAEVSTFNGKGKFELKIDYPNWGRYMIRVSNEASGHSAGKVVYIDWPAWAGRRDNQAGAATMLTFSTDKEKYNVGDNVNLTIPTGADGRVLISLETGSKVLKSYWVETTKGFTKFSFKVTPEMAPNIYANVTYLQPHAQTKNDLPIRLYGVIPIQIEDPKTHLRPLIKCPEVIKPESIASVAVREENGKPMTYTLAMVDEGLLDLTRFKTPDPWAAFYAREALGVKSWDMFDFVMGAYGAELERILSIGGDGEGGKKEGAKANRFKPMVRFIGPFTLKQGETKQHKIAMPQYVGSVRIMVIAGKNGAYGNTEKTVAVRKPLMVLGTMPRIVGPDEEVKLPISVYAMEKFVKNVSVQVTTNSLISVNGFGKKAVNFSQIGDQLVSFDIKVKGSTGIGKIKIIATCGKEVAVQDIEFDVRNPNPEMTTVIEHIINAGSSWNTDYTPVGMEGSNEGILEISSIPPINLDNRLQYLIQYPHGCVEQTTSSVFPQLCLNELMEIDPQQKKIIESNIKAGIQRLKSFQVANGGLSYWQGETYTDDWGTCYAGHFMLEASERGYTLPVGFIEAWKKYQRQRSLAWTYSNTYYNNDLIQAYRLYTLALAKAPELGAMNQLREQAAISISAKWRLAAAYQLAGQPEIAKKLVYNISTTIKPYREMCYSYGSGERDEAMIIEALTLMNMRSKAAYLVKELSKSLSNNQWMSTQTTAYSLVAISKFVKGGGATQSEMKFTYTINKGKQSSLVSAKTIAQIKMNLKGSAQKGKILFSNTGKGLLYARLILHGTPKAGKEKAEENGMKLKVNFKTLKGEELNPEKLEQGTDFMAEVIIHNNGTTGDYKQLALSQIFPSGWEIHNTRMDEYSNAVITSKPTYQDIRDDRVYTYFNLNANETKIFRVLLNASYLGKFYLPSFACEAMYDNTIYARSNGKWVEIVLTKSEIANK